MADARAHTCSSTGLRLVPSRGEVIHRLAKESYGAMNPPERVEGTNRAAWGRFDVPGRPVIYGATPMAACYAEALAYFRVAEDIATTKLGDMFDDLEGAAADRPLADVVSQEWAAKNHMPPNGVPAGWRNERLIYALRLPASGWFVDVCHADTIAQLDAQFRDVLEGKGIARLTQAHLLGDDRDSTTMFSEWFWRLTLDDGSRPHGVRFPSKHGANYFCFAIYLRRLADGAEVSTEPTSADDGKEIGPPARNSPLRQVTQNFKMTCH
ncbi:RES domain-containing protein [Nocardioides taihuensis]|uniref:RES domain-containing protein n=1 Tax=Nocardioides taihuensis TaxID=1835606 RepID=A0ABW0BJI9_9ACTN